MRLPEFVKIVFGAKMDKNRIFIDEEGNKYNTYELGIIFTDFLKSGLSLDTYLEKICFEFTRIYEKENKKFEVVNV